MIRTFEKKAMYWDIVLNEILNKDQPARSFTLTNKSAKTGLIKDTRATLVISRPKPKKYWLGEKYPGVYFTEREAQTISHFFHGKTIVEVAKMLNLSHRTIEFYLKNMKLKLNCRFKSELMGKVVESEFFEVYRRAKMQEEKEK